MPDIAANTNTTSAMDVNTTFSGSLETAGDRDWVRIELAAGQEVRITMGGIGANELSDPLVRVRDANGAILQINDDAGPNTFDSGLTFEATQAGTYFVEAASFGNSYAGGYLITAQDVGPLNSIAWGTAIDLDVVNVFFAPNGQTFDGYTSEGFNAYERGQIIEIMELLSDMIDLDFNIVTSANQADAVLVLDLNEISNEPNPYLGYFNPPGELGEGIGVFNGDLWDRNAGGDLERGGFGYVTIVHELLHGLGLAHPHDNGGTSGIMNGVGSPFDDYGDFNLNQGIFTVMTYNTGYWTGTSGSAPANASGGDFGFEGGAMALDIAMLQLLYGANMNHAGGNTTYNLTDANGSGTFWESIWDTGGTDLIRYDGTRDTTIDLREATLEYGLGGGGFVSAANGIRGGFTIANGVVIENARGGTGDDTLIGNNAANLLVGANGHDFISGGGGHDRMVGGNGADQMFGANGNDDIDGNNGHDRMFGDNGNDTMDGGAGNDRMIGGNGNDRMSGSTGIDSMYGGNANDVMFGGDGNDRMYGNDGVDRLYGGDGYDRLVGQNGDDRLIGGTGSDRFFGGAGMDVMIGGGGRDGFSFVSANDSAVGANRDQINDFDGRYDVINLRTIDADTGVGGNQAFDFIGTSGFSGNAGEVRVIDSGANMIVAGDNDGDGQADFEILLIGVQSMATDDFIL